MAGANFAWPKVIQMARRKNKLTTSLRRRARGFEKSRQDLDRVEIDVPPSAREAPPPELKQTGTSVSPAPLGVAEAASPPAGLPTEPLPARMLNEFVYCPRLFYYEFVEGVFVENADTLRGAAIHARVDSGFRARCRRPRGSSRDRRNLQHVEIGTRRMRPETIHCRSVSLGSERLGVTAKIDLVEIVRTEDWTERRAERSFCQQSRSLPGGLQSGRAEGRRRRQRIVGYGQDAARVAVSDSARQRLHLQRGIIYYRATKQRVRLPITPELEAGFCKRSPRRGDARPVDSAAAG